MTYLLDVNALIALGFNEHEFHDRVARWVQQLESRAVPDLATCSITELGFVRILAQAPLYGFSVGQACELLGRLKIAPKVTFTFLPDVFDISGLPKWVKTAKQITDGHLVQLAASHRALLATLDKHIPQAFLIPT
jgi:uncharacterized protein